MKVVLATPPGKTTERWPPLGLLYIASSCQAVRDDDIRVIDAFCENLSGPDLVQRILREAPDVVGMNCSTHTFLDAIQVVNELREALPEAILVLGGIQATFAAERILREYPAVDYVVRGEAEHSFPQLMERVEEGRAAADVAGVASVEGGRYLEAEPQLIDDLDSLPFPARELARDVEYAYFHKNIRLTFGKLTTISSSRGCPFRCTYCSCAAFSNRRWRPRSPENVVDELERLQADGYECCVFVDDNLTHSRRRIERICDLIKDRRVRMQFYCEGRVDSASASLMRKMKKAGFNVIYFGVESAQRHVLDYYKKTIDPDQARDAIWNAKRAGMLVVASYILGAPNETEEDMHSTVNLIKGTRTHAVQVNILDCLVGTEIWRDLERRGILDKDDWKRNHRVYEYGESCVDRRGLEELVNLGYSAHIDSWKSAGGALDILTALASNGSARDIVAGNLLNPEARRRLVDSRRFSGDRPVDLHPTDGHHARDG